MEERTVPRVSSGAQKLHVPMALSPLTLSVDTRRLRAEHAVIADALADLCVVADALPDLGLAARTDLLQIAASLGRRLNHHAQREEEELYPQLASLYGESKLVDALIHDHRAIGAAADELACSDSFDDCPRVQARVYGLQLLVATHMDTEEQVVFPMFEPDGTSA